MQRRRGAVAEAQNADPGAPPAGERFPIVGVGASAGGLDALRTLFTAMPADSGMGFVLTQHLDADHHSLLAELLAKYTNMPVVQVENGMGVEPDHVYVIPPNTYMTVSDGVLLLKPPTDARGMRMPIDRFFFSLAADQQDKAVGIILSGSGSDGTLGVREIKAAGGMVMVQDPETAQYDGMPRSAIATGQVDAVLPLERIPEVLTNYVRHAYIEHLAPTLPGLDTSYDALTAILALLLAKTGHDFRCYKKGTLVRRTHRRMGITGVESFEDYLDLLRGRDEEVRALAKDLFIGVTSFFRESDAWSAIAEQVIAPLVESHARDGPVRVWVPGCASGEEAYTLAMLFAEAFERANKKIDLLVFATDVDSESLQVGRAGLYIENIAESVGPERLSQFFTKEGDGYRVKKWLHDLVVFTSQNLIADPPFSKLDLISCRNLLIYLEPKLQDKILRLFHFSLNPDGYLVLGSSETLGQQQREFRTLSKKWRIFQPEGPSQLGLMEMPLSREADRSVPRFLARGLARREPNLADMAQQALVETFAPASVLVTRRYQVLYVYGDTSDYLAHPPGELTDDLIAMTRTELRMKTRAALHQAIAESRQVSLHGVRIARGTGQFPVAVTVTPLQKPPLVAGLLLVSFHREPMEIQQAPEREPGQGPETDVVRQLEDELKTTREELQSTIEELETSNEELKASNEEVMSMNEELQCSNEELETSKEELQSLNEELTTVNNQLQNKLTELEATGNDLNNLLASTNIATLFLDPALRIRRFTPATNRLMNLIPEDVGRPVADIAHKYANDQLRDDCRKVMEDLRTVGREVRGEDNTWYIRRVQPYRTQDNRIEGTVVTFTDITAMKRRDGEHARLASIVGSSSEAIVGATLQGVITSWNPGAEALYGYRAEQAVGQSIAKLWPEGCHDELARILAEIQAGRRVGPYETEHRRQGGRLVQVSITISPVCDAGGEPMAGAIIASDATERNRAETALRQRVELQEQLARVAAAVPGVICSYRLRPDGSACMPYASAALTDLLGVEPQDVTEDFGPIRAQVHPEDAERFEATIAESARTLKPWHDIFRYRHPRKGEIFLEGHSVPLRQPDGSVLWHGYVQDISERKQMERALGDKHAELEQHAALLADADRRKDEFLAILGHELRNPLTPIRNAVHLLSRQDGLAETARRAVDMIGRQSRQLEHLVNDLLDVSRITHGQIRMQKVPVVMQDALRNALESVSPLLETRLRTLDTRLVEVPLVVRADPVRLGQVLINLLSNAVKYTPDGGKIEVSLAREGPQAVVRVRDDGVGIPAQFLPRLFEVFSRGEGEHDDRLAADGLGVGLALARQLVERHDGVLEGYSDGPGKGSEFVVRLPLSSDTKPAPPAPVESVGISDTRTRRILVVDDNSDVADSFRFLLETMGQRVRVLNAGREVLGVIREWKPDVVFLDIAMPGMDGYRVAAAVRAADLDPRPFLVALTGYGQASDRRTAIEAGFDRHLLKPPAPEEVEALLADLA